MGRSAPFTLAILAWALLATAPSAADPRTDATPAQRLGRHLLESPRLVDPAQRGRLERFGVTLHLFFDEFLAWKARGGATAGDVTTFEAEIAPRSHWILEEHRTREGLAVLPGTGYLEIARAAFQEIHGPAALEMRDVTFLAPLAVDDYETRRMRVKIENESFEVSSEQGGHWTVHAQGRATATESQHSILDASEISARLQGERWDDPSGVRTPQEEHLLFGTRWRNLTHATFGNGEALATLVINRPMSPQGYGRTVYGFAGKRRFESFSFGHVRCHVIPLTISSIHL